MFAFRKGDYLVGTRHGTAKVHVPRDVPLDAVNALLAVLDGEEDEEDV